MERPILFSGPMVRAILDGRKSMTRRVVKEIPMLGTPIAWCAAAKAQEPGWVHIVGDYRRFCPYGIPGDRLWVRETWRVGAWDDESHSIAVDYQADNFIRREWLPCDPPEMYTRLRHQSVMDAIRANAPVDKDGIFSWSPGNAPCRWRPSIFMPRWASRITLEITGVRVERVQEITEEDASKEGTSPEFECDVATFCTGGKIPGSTYKLGFKRLWNSINKKRGYGWDDKPWVWVIEFKRVEADHD